MMRHKILAFSTLALAALVWPATTSYAAGRGGGGGGHGGGGYHGGYGGYHGGYGGYRGGYGFYPGIGIGIGGYGGYGYGYGGLGRYGAYSAGYGNAGLATAPAAVLPNPVVVAPAAQGLAPSSEENPPTPPQLTNTAQVHIFVPADAKVWVGGEATTPIGGERDFTSTELVPGKVYFYRVKAQWMKDGKMVEQTQKVRVRANETSNVTFGE